MGGLPMRPECVEELAQIDPADAQPARKRRADGFLGQDSTEVVELRNRLLGLGLGSIEIGGGDQVLGAQITGAVFSQRRIGTDTLPSASPKLLPLEEATEAKRVAIVSQQFGGTSPGLEHYSTEVLFRDLWLRPDLAPIDRSLITVY